MKACVPLAIQVVIDDVGWWCGQDGHERGEPFRTGCGRDHVVADYAAIIDLGRRLGMRPQAALVLCEWDRTNLLRALPSSTWMGARWDNRRWVGPWLDEAAALVGGQAAHIELTLHGVGHEFWSGPSFTRAEWHDKEGRMRAESEVRAHLEAFRHLMEQNGLGVFPTSFVPAAFLHGFGSGLAGILAEYGVRYISTPYHTMTRTRTTEDDCFGIEDGVLTVDRGRDVLNWRVIGGEPATECNGPVCGMHWPNLLHVDPARNAEVVDRWVRLLQPYNARFDRLLAPDTATGFSQLVYHRWTRVSMEGQRVLLDFQKMDAVSAKGILDSFYVKVEAGETVRLSGEGVSVVETLREGAHWRLKLQRERGCSRARLFLSS